MVVCELTKILSVEDDEVVEDVGKNRTKFNTACV